MTKINFKLSENEKQILETMWREERSLTRSEVINLTENKTWKKSSIHILLNQLLDKDAIEVDEIVRTGKSYGRTYKPTVTKKEYEIMQLQNSFKEINPSNSSISSFLSGLVKSNNISRDTIDELQELVNQNKEE